MAGHLRTTPAPGARRTSKNTVRRNRQHLPDGEADQHARERIVAAGKSTAYQRINARSGDLAKVDAAREYLRSAAAKYDLPPGWSQPLVDQLVRQADQIIRTGTRRPAKKKKKEGGERRGRAA